MKIEALRDYAKGSGVTQIINNVRVNVNGFPYITVVDKDNKAENIYFSKPASAQVAVGQVLTISDLKGLYIAHTTNERGEPRLKLTFNSRVDIADLFD